MDQLLLGESRQWGGGEGWEPLEMVCPDAVHLTSPRRLSLPGLLENTLLHTSLRVSVVHIIWSWSNLELFGAPASFSSNVSCWCFRFSFELLGMNSSSFWIQICQVVCFTASWVRSIPTVNKKLHQLLLQGWPSYTWINCFFGDDSPTHM